MSRFHRAILLVPFLVLAACGATPPAAAPPSAGDRPPEIRTERLAIRSGGETIAAEIFLPAGDGPHPGLVVIHEWWGLNDQVRGEARRLAAEGYAALAVDLYRGRAAADRDEAHELMRGLPEDRATGDLRAAFGALAARPDVDAGRIGAIGWCMGGGYALTLATVETGLAACVVYYGRLPAADETLRRIEAPVLGLFGAEDRGIPPDSVRAFEASMRRLGKEAETVLYDGAGHAFANAERESHKSEAAADARRRTREFLAGRLGK